MSKTIDERVVQMSFDNSQFEKNVQVSMSTLDKLKQSLNFTGASKGLEHISNVAGNVNMSPLSNAVENVKMKFSAMEVVAATALMNITNSAVNAGKKIVSALTIAPIKAGFQEYETQMNSVQTILANTSHAGTDLDDVNRALDELNLYADKTIYNFTQMTRNIGTFTAAGLGLEESTKAIKGIANLAAVSGSTSQQASTAMYQLSQALANGTVNLQDWNSVVNAGMGGKVFQDALVRTAAAMKGVTEETFRATNITGSFRESISSKGGPSWLTADVLSKTLQQFTGDLTDAELAAMGFTAEQIKNIQDLAVTANDAATKVKTVTQLWDTLQESAQSGWTQTWEILIGDFEEAKELLTMISDSIGGLIGNISDSRNKLLGGAFTSGWKQLLEKGISDSGEFENVVIDVAKEHNVKMDEMIKDEIKFQDTLKQGWMTTEILSKSITKYGEKLNAMTEAEREAAGYTMKDIEAFQALQQGITDGTVSIDELVKKMNRLSGREVVIQGFTNVFKGLGSVIKPVMEAFDEVVPKLSSEQLYEFLSKFANITEKFKLTEEASNNLKRTFKGLFSLINVVKEVLFALGKVIAPVVGFILKLGEGILSVTAILGDYLLLISDVVGRTKIFSKVMDGLGGVIMPVVNFIKAAISKIAELFTSFDTINITELENFTNKVMEACAPITKIGDFFEWAFKGLTGIMEKIFDGMMFVLGGLKEVFTNIFDAKTFGAISGLVTGGFLMKMVYKVGDIIELVKSLIPGKGDGGGLFSDMFSGVTDALGELQGCLEGFQQSIKANTIIKIAVAVGILAGALSVISHIDPDKLANSLGTVTALMGELVGTMILFQYATAGLDSAKGTGAMIGMSIAILILANALKEISGLNTDQLATGLLGVTALIVETIGAAILLSKFSGDISKTAIGLVIFSYALDQLSDVVKKLSEIPAKSLIKGLGSVLILCGELVAFLKFAKFDSISIKGTAGLILLAGAINILAVAVDKFSKIKSTSLLKGLGGVAIVLGELVAFMRVMKSPEKMIAMSTGLVVLGGALLVIGESVRLLGSLDTEQLLQGLFAVIGLLGGLALALSVMPTTNILATSTGLVILGGALLIIGEVLRQLGGMDADKLIQGVFGLASALGVIGVAVTAMNGTIAGAGALLVVAGALAILAPVLKMFGGMETSEVCKSLLTLAGALGVIIAAGYLAAPIIAPLMGLAGAITLLGVGCLAAGVGVLAFSAGLASLAVSGAAGVSVIVLMVTELLNLIPLFVVKVGEGLVLVLQLIINNAPLIGQAFLTILETIVDTIVKGIPLIVEAIFLLLTELLAAVIEFVPKLVDGGMTIIKALLKGISDNIYEIVILASDIIINFINGLAEKLPDIIDAGVNLIIQFIEGMADAIVNRGPELINAFLKLLASVIKAILITIMGWIEDLKETGKEIMESGFIQGIKDKIEDTKKAIGETIDGMLGKLGEAWDSFWQAGSDLIAGLASGIAGGVDAAITAIGNVASTVISKAKEYFDEHSPSKVFEGIGRYLDEGLAIGIEKNVGTAVRATETLGKETIKAMNRTIGSIASDEIDAQPTIRPIFDMSSVEDGARAINGLFSDTNLAVGANVNGNISSISGMMNNSQNATNNDIISAIKDLNKAISNSSGDTITIGGITYDDGSNITNAVQSLVRAARVERRI